MNSVKLERMRNGKGFIAALDQSGGSTPKALKAYGINDDKFNNSKEMFDLVQEMRSRIIKSEAFDSRYIIGAILFENTMDRKIDGLYVSDYLWENKKILPFLKIDNGLDIEVDDIQLMKPIPNINELLDRAKKRNIFGTKMRSVIHANNIKGIREIVVQQFDFARIISAKGLIPIIEPEVDIYSGTKKEAEDILLEEVKEQLSKLDDSIIVMFKFSIPTKTNLYEEIMNDKHVLRVVALSGGYSRKEANILLEKNHNLIASFSRALLSDLSVTQTDKEFDKVLADTISEIYQASIS